MNMAYTSPGPERPSDLSRDRVVGTRRNFLSGAIAVGLAALLPGTGFSAPSGITGNRRIIDIHHHFAPKVYVDFAKRHGMTIKTYHDQFKSPWGVSRDLQDMDKAGTLAGLLSITAPGFGIGKLGVADVRKIIRQCNEAALGYTTDYPGRFGSLAAIPLPDTEGSLLELAYALDTLKADGVTVFSNYQNRWLGDASYYPVYEELNRRKAVVFVHPTAGDCCAHLVPDVNDNIIEFAADTTRTIASLLYTGATIRYPDIRWVFSHGGGAVPFLVERFLLGSGEVEIVPGIITRGQYGPPPSNLPEGALPEIRKLHFDTAHTSNPIALSALKQLVPVSQIIFGSDYWYRTAEETAANIYASQVLTDQELSMVLRENAERLFPRLASAA